MNRRSMNGALWVALALAVTTQTARAQAPCSSLRVSGRVVEADTGDGIVGAVVTASGESTLTDATGRYELNLVGEVALPLSLVATMDGIYQPAARSIEASTNCSVSLDLQLSSDDEGGETIVVERRRLAAPRSEATTLLARQQASVVSDAISAEEMSRTPDSSASGAVKRIVSATVVDNRYVVLRGLGDRYVSTLINGVPLPSPEPDRQAVPLDLFPTSLLANLTVVKSYSADYPATFGGGALDIRTNSYPEDFTLAFKLNTGANSVTPLDRSQSMGAGGSFFGYRTASRLPDAVPTDGPVLATPGGMSEQTVETIGESFRGQWSADADNAYPNLGIGMTLGDTVSLRGRQLGYLVTVLANNRYAGREANVAKIRSTNAGNEYREQMTSSQGQQTSTVGGLASVGFRPSLGHELSLLSLYTHTGEGSATVVEGFNETDGQDIEATRLRFVERAMSFSQLSGNHTIGDDALRIAWQTHLGFTSSNEPDTRDSTYNIGAGDSYRFKSEPGSGEIFSSELSERALGAGVDLTVPSSFVALRAGASIQNSERHFDARRFRFVYTGDDPSVLFLPPEEMLSAEHIGNSFTLEERTLGTDRYDADQLVAAGYGAMEMHLSDSLRLGTGARYELASQDLQSLSPYAVGAMDPVSVSRDDSGLLMAINITQAIGQTQNVRLAYGSTLARPRFRELAPFLFFDYTRRRSISGNPDLEETHIHHADLRWEWFPGATEVISASTFYKYFVDPIEQVIVSASGGDVSYDNASGASLVGAEIEGRVDLVRFAPWLDGVRLAANVALMRSKISLSPEQRMSQTSLERPMQGQSPFAVNVALAYAQPKYQIGSFYHVYGQRISEVGFDSLPDVYEKPFHRLDLSFAYQLASALRLKANASNLLAQRQRFEQGGLEVFAFDPGVSVGLGLEWNP